MSGLAGELERYLELRRQMGFKLHRAEKLLRQFVTYCETQGIEVVTAAVALQWAGLPERPSPAWVSMRLRVVRGFTRHLSLVDERHQVVPTALVPARATRATPYLYSEQEVMALMAAVHSLGSPMRQASYAAIIGLLWVTGMRVGEALALDTTDVDLAGGVLTVREAKFGKTRELPVHDTTTEALGAYLKHPVPVVPATHFAGVLPLGCGHPRPLLQLPLGLSTTRAPRRPDSAFGALPAPAARLFATASRCAPSSAGIATAPTSRDAPAPFDLPRPPAPGQHVLVFVRRARAARAGRRTPGAEQRGAPMSALAPTLEAFFTQRLMAQRHASAHTIAAYRDTFRLLLGFVEEQAGKRPAALDIEDLNAARISAFLDHLECGRGNTVRTRNARLAAIHSLFRFAALRHPEHAELIERVLAIPPKRFQRRIVSFLTDDEVNALLAAPDRSTFLGRRDHALLLTAIQTGLRVTELIGLRLQDVVLGTGAHVRCVGKGRKERATPLTPQTAEVLRCWLTERGGAASDPLFATSQGAPLSRYGVSAIVKRHVAAAAACRPSLATKKHLPACASAHRGHAPPARRSGHHRDRAVARSRRR